MPEIKSFAQSDKFTLNSTDFAKLGRGLLIAIVSAGLTYVTEQLPGVDLGEWSPAVVALWMVVSDVIRRWVYGPAPIETNPSEF